MYNQIIHAGMYGPVFMILLAVWQLYYLPKYLLWFFVFLWINESIIIFTKQVIQQPRPGQPVLRDSHLPSMINPLRQIVELLLLRVESSSQNVEYGYYGMPSGHAQHALFIMSFVWLVNPSWAMLCIYIVITGITILERYNAKRHTLEQLFVGGICGCILAYSSVMIMRNYYEYN